MCGIAGIMSKTEIDAGTLTLDMMRLVQHRGRDASGIALFSGDGFVTLRASLKSNALLPKLRTVVGAYASMLSEKPSDGFFECTLKPLNVNALHNAINDIDGVSVHSLGDSIKVYKENGEITNLTKRHNIPKTKCRLAIGHVRMATESNSDVNAAHPLTSPFYPSLAIVHNGQFTNYYNTRRFLESKGARFKTQNDTEAASHLIAYIMSQNGGNLSDALRYAANALDGVFCIIAATPRQIGFAKDNLGIKPMLIADTPDCLILGSEQIEFSAVSGDLYADETAPGEVRVWNI
ncbi:glutamine amidotransferase [Clostridia bacterium]|nr:glutamine amidotransferase [Clostridia bacterium]